MNFHTFVEALFSITYLKGAFVAVSLATLVEIAAILLGFFLALARISRSRFLRGLSAAYVWIFRAVPALLVLIMIWNALPQLMPIFRSQWFTPYLGALLGLALVETANMTEIIRASITGVDPGQTLAARAIGLSPRRVYWYVLVPQMTRIAIPTIGNQYINMIKMTSLASVISLQELLYMAQQDVSITFSYAEYYTAAAVYYMVIVSILMFMQSYLERRYTWLSNNPA